MNLHVPIVFILGKVLGLEWHLPICYQNPPFSWENACTKSGMCCFSVVQFIENRWLSFLSVLSVFVDFPFWMRLGVRYHCYYLYLVVYQQIWRNLLPLFFPRYIEVKKTQHYKLFISNPIVLFWRTKKITNCNITGRTVSALPTEELLEKLMLAKTKHKKLWKFYWNPFCCLGRVMNNASILSLLYSLVWQLHSLKWQGPKVKKFEQELLKWENKNRRCTMTFGTKEFMKLMNLAIWY